MQNETNDLSLILSDVVVAAEPLVRGLRKLPEDMEWSYSGLCVLWREWFAKNTMEIHNDLRCFVDRKWIFWLALRMS